MSSDVDRFMNDLDKTIVEIFEALEKNKSIKIKHKKSSMGLDITTNITISLGLLESLDMPKHDQTKEEPLIDVIETEYDIKIIAIIPGIKKDDIRIASHDGFIELEIKKEDHIFCKKIFCNAKLNKLFTKSLNYNNSVLEIVFDREVQNGNSV